MYWDRFQQSLVNSLAPQLGGIIQAEVGGPEDHSSERALFSQAWSASSCNSFIIRCTMKEALRAGYSIFDSSEAVSKLYPSPPT